MISETSEATLNYSVKLTKHIEIQVVTPNFKDT